MPNRYRSAKKGFIYRENLRNPDKFKGLSPLVYRSGLELRTIKWLDESPYVMAWEGDDLGWDTNRGKTTSRSFIPYFDPISQRDRRYFYDFKVLIKGTDGTERVWLAEVKSKSECGPPKRKSRVTRSFLDRMMTWQKNKAKWEAARKFCEERGWKFQVLNEDHLKKIRPILSK